MKSTAMMIIAASLAMAAATAADVDVSKLPPAAKKAGVTFDKDIKAIFEKSCEIGRAHV